MTEKQNRNVHNYKEHQHKKELCYCDKCLIHSGVLKTPNYPKWIKAEKQEETCEKCGATKRLHEIGEEVGFYIIQNPNDKDWKLCKKFKPTQWSHPTFLPKNHSPSALREDTPSGNSKSELVKPEGTHTRQNAKSRARLNGKPWSTHTSAEKSLSEKILDKDRILSTNEVIRIKDVKEAVKRLKEDFERTFKRTERDIQQTFNYSARKVSFLDRYWENFGHFVKRIDKIFGEDLR